MQLIKQKYSEGHAQAAAEIIERWNKSYRRPDKDQRIKGYRVRESMRRKEREKRREQRLLERTG